MLVFLSEASQKKIEFLGVHHVGVLVQDLERSLDFYCGTLGGHPPNILENTFTLCPQHRILLQGTVDGKNYLCILRMEFSVPA